MTPNWEWPLISRLTLRNYYEGLLLGARYMLYVDGAKFYIDVAREFMKRGSAENARLNAEEAARNINHAIEVLRKMTEKGLPSGISAELLVDLDLAKNRIKEGNYEGALVWIDSARRKFVWLMMDLLSK